MEETVRVDAIIKSRFAGLSRRHIDEALESGLVVDACGKRVKKGDYLSPSSVELRRLAEQLEFLSRGNSDLRLKIVGEDDDSVVVEKPANMACAPQSLLDSQSVTAWA